MLCDRYSSFPPLQKANKVLQGGRVLAFYRIAPCLKNDKYLDIRDVYIQFLC